MSSTSLTTVIVVGALIALTLAMVRLLRGPSHADRVVALDVVFSCCLALAAAAALSSGRVLFLDVAVGLAVVSFVATIVWSRLIDMSRKDPQ